jgi:uncharacterized alkaline shock family protein YloU
MTSDATATDKDKSGLGSKDRPGETKSQVRGEVASVSRDSRLSGPGRRPPSAHASLISEHGQTHIAEGVVAKIAAMASREIPGVHSMGTGMARRMGHLRKMIPGTTSDDPASAQGVSVEVGEREAAVDLDVVTWYGQNIVDVCESVRNNVIDRVESMTGLKVVEVNINVDDVFVETDDADMKKQRVQ